MRNRPGEAGAVGEAKVRGNRREEARLGNCGCSLIACAPQSWPSVPFPGILLAALRILGTLYLVILFLFPQQHLKWGVVFKRLGTSCMGTPPPSLLCLQGGTKVSLVSTVCQT